jgi:hypothetical protein
LVTILLKRKTTAGKGQKEKQKWSSRKDGQFPALRRLRQED